jgi:hypothetical protein
MAFIQPLVSNASDGANIVKFSIDFFEATANGFYVGHYRIGLYNDVCGFHQGVV